MESPALEVGKLKLDSLSHKGAVQFEFSNLQPPMLDFPFSNFFSCCLSHRHPVPCGFPCKLRPKTSQITFGTKVFHPVYSGLAVKRAMKPRMKREVPVVGSMNRE